MFELFFPRQRVTRLVWCRFTAAAFLLCGAAYLAGEYAASHVPRAWFGQHSRLGDIAVNQSNGGTIFFTGTLLLLAVPFILLSVRRMKDAALSPWGLTVPPLLFCLGLGVMMLFFSLAETDPKSIGGMTGQDAWIAFCSFIMMGIAAPASAAALMFFMAFVKGRDADGFRAEQQPSPLLSK